MMRDRGVSEVVGYIYVFGIIMAVTAITYLQINNFVDQTQKHTLQQGIEQSFKRLQYAVYDVAFGNANSKSINIEVGKGTISLQNKGYIRLFFNYTAPPASCPGNFELKCINMTTGEVNCSGPYGYMGCLYNVTLNSIVYGQGGQIVSLEAGGVFSKTAISDSLLSEPKIMNVSVTANKQVLILTVPEMSPEYSRSGGKLEITMRRNSSDTIFIDTSSLTPTPTEFHIFIIGTDFKNSWCEYFDTQNIRTEFFDKEWCTVGHLACTCKSGVVHGYIKTQSVKEYLVSVPKIVLAAY